METKAQQNKRVPVNTAKVSQERANSNYTGALAALTPQEALDLPLHNANLSIHQTHLVQMQRLVGNHQVLRQLRKTHPAILRQTEETQNEPIDWNSIPMTGAARYFRRLFPVQPTQAEAELTTQRTLVQLDDMNFLGRRALFLSAAAEFLSQVPAPLLIYGAALDLHHWATQTATDMTSADNLSAAALTTLLATAMARPKITYDALESDYGPAGRDEYMVRILRLKRANDGHTEALRLQSRMNPMAMSSGDIEGAIDEYRDLNVTLNLVNPTPPPEDEQTTGTLAPDRVPAQVAMQFSLRTPYHINTAERRGARGANWHRLPRGHNVVQAGKGSAAQTESAVQDFLTASEQQAILTATFYDTYNQTQGTAAEKLAAAQNRVEAQAQELLSTHQIGVDCSGTVVHVLLSANADMEATLLHSRNVSSVDELALNTNVRMLTARTAGGSGGNISSRLRDLSSAMPGTMIQMGTGHIGGIISNDLHSLATLPGEILGSRAAIATSLSIANNDDQRVRVVRYYHSIDETRPNEGGGVRFTNSNLPGPHTAWIVFRIPADGGTNDITDPTRWIQDVNWTYNYTGLYVVTQRELMAGVVG